MSNIWSGAERKVYRFQVGAVEARRGYAMKITENFWAVVDKDGKIVIWSSIFSREEGLEIHRTRRLAKGACFKQDGEKVVKVKVIHEK